MSNRRRIRSLSALLTALLVHGLVLLVVETREVRQIFPRRERVAIAIVPQPATPNPAAPEPEPEPEPPAEPIVEPPATPRAKTTTPEPTTPEPTMQPTPPQPAPPQPSAPQPTTTPATEPLPSAPTDSVMRLPKGSTSMDRVLGTGGELGPSRRGLETALDLKAEGPLRDSQAAARTARRLLQEDLSDDAVTAGLADDYFRTLRGHVETAWRPEMKQLNDGGASTTQLGMLRSFGSDTAAWDEMWRAYNDLARQYANGAQPKLEPDRKDRLRELMRSRKGAFRVHAISEVKLTQSPDGKVLLLELPLPSGHPNIDEGMRNAIAEAILAMADPPSARVHHGRSFSSWWRLRATWTMVPPTAFLTGAAFDITAKGFSVDVPFDIKLKTNVMLLRTDTRPGGGEADDATAN